MYTNQNINKTIYILPTYNGTIFQFQKEGVGHSKD